jgi:hypothetical protein
LVEEIVAKLLHQESVPIPNSMSTKSSYCVPCDTGGLEALLNLKELGVGDSVPDDLDGKKAGNGSIIDEALIKTERE